MPVEHDIAMPPKACCVAHAAAKDAKIAELRAEVERQRTIMEAAMDADTFVPYGAIDGVQFSEPPRFGAAATIIRAALDCNHG